MSTSKLGAWNIANRSIASLLGGYLFVWGFAALGVVCSVALGARYEEAEQIFFLLGIFVYLTCFFAAFVAQRPSRIWIVLAGGGTLMTGAAWLLGRVLVRG